MDCVSDCGDAAFIKCNGGAANGICETLLGENVKTCRMDCRANGGSFNE